MKKFLTLVVALMMVIPMMAIGDNDGSTQLDAIDFNWDAPTKHSGGMKWYWTCLLSMKRKHRD